MAPQNVSVDYDLIFLLIKSFKCYFYEYFPIPPLALQWELSKFPAFVKGNLFICLEGGRGGTTIHFLVVFPVFLSAVLLLLSEACSFPMRLITAHAGPGGT